MIIIIIITHSFIYFKLTNLKTNCYKNIQYKIAKKTGNYSN